MLRARLFPFAGAPPVVRAQTFWLDLLYYPENWHDNRPQTGDSRKPDFKHKESNQALWLDAETAKQARCLGMHAAAARPRS
jgi:hypothetical protein